MMRVGLVKPWFAYGICFGGGSRIDCLLDSGVTTKETLLSFDTLANDPERAVGPARTRSRQGLPLVVNGVSCWVRSKMEEGPGATSDLVKVMSVDLVSPV